MPRLTFTTLAALLLVVSPAAAQHHAHEAAPAAAPLAAPANRFATDEPLRRNMQEITDIVESLGHAAQGHVPPDRAVLLAGRVESHVKAIIADCQLPPDADAALHRIIVPLLQQARALQAAPADPAPVAVMQSALADYARLFDMPAPPAGDG